MVGGADLPREGMEALADGAVRFARFPDAGVDEALLEEAFPVVAARAVARPDRISGAIRKTSCACARAKKDGGSAQPP